MISRALLLIVLALATAPAARAATRYASPAGTGDCTTAATACPLATAFGGAASGDEVVVGVGTYPAGGALDGAGKTLTVRGEVTGAGRPVLPMVAITVAAGSVVRDLDLGSVTLTAAAGERLLVRGSCTVAPGGQVLDSVCGTGLSTTGAVGAARTVRNVTAGAGAFGGGTTAATSSILGGTVTCAAGTNTFVSDAYVDGGGCGAGANTVAPPAYESGTFRPVAGSLSIDKGVDAGAGALDLNGNLRAIGAHVDIGAYERPPAPAVVAGAGTTTTADGAAVQGVANTGGGRGRAYFEYGPGFSAQTAPQALPAATGPAPVTASLTGLGDAPTPYRLVVETDGGTSRSDDQVAYRAPTLTAGAPGAVALTTATLNGTVALKGAPSGTVEFVYGAATSPPQTITADGAVRADLTGLTPRTAYKWKLRVTRGGEVFETPLGTFTTGTPPVPGSSPSPSPEPIPAPAARKPSFTVGTGTGSAAARRKAGRLLLRGRGLVVRVRCGSAACRTVASGTVSVRGRRFGILAAPRKALELGAGERGQIRLTANRRLRRRVRRALARHARAKATIRLKAVFTDADGHRLTRRATISVRRLKG